MSSSATLPPSLVPWFQDHGTPQWAERVNTRVASRFRLFLERLRVTPDQERDAATKVGEIVSALNAHYYRSPSPADHRIIEGSWGKGTQGRPPRDVDVIFVLPYSVYLRFEQRTGNKQSQLLSEVKEVIRQRHPRTELRQDGQVVMVEFENGHGVEVVPAFALDRPGQYWICNTRDNGSYKAIDPGAEILAVEQSDAATQSTTRELVRMAKRWQALCDVEGLPSFVIELIVIDFLPTVTYGLGSRGLHDWLVRDFFAYLISRANTQVVVPGTGNRVNVGQVWLPKAETALSRARLASRLEELERHDRAREVWQTIFGRDLQ